jgi:WD40 repeat protein
MYCIYLFVLLYIYIFIFISFPSSIIGKLEPIYQIGNGDVFKSRSQSKLPTPIKSIFVSSLIDRGNHLLVGYSNGVVCCSDFVGTKVINKDLKVLDLHEKIDGGGGENIKINDNDNNWRNAVRMTDIINVPSYPLILTSFTNGKIKLYDYKDDILIAETTHVPHPMEVGTLPTDFKNKNVTPVISLSLHRNKIHLMSCGYDGSINYYDIRNFTEPIFSFVDLERLYLPNSNCKFDFIKNKPVNIMNGKVFLKKKLLLFIIIYIF